MKKKQILENFILRIFYLKIHTCQIPTESNGVLTSAPLTVDVLRYSVKYVAPPRHLL